ncbi:Hypothetical protein FKW44_010509 [Caligus rogercresseyi]|uniref:Uncharacterized protein n=1 Tax=Caligus rogercresseyi TaxID=217165 RepID=A0A7T8HH90_CALRO|nr:Hypothetical protein FKW44_010509 [Caligus rogercresseyi]
MREPPMIRVEYSIFTIRPNEGTSTHTDNALTPKSQSPPFQKGTKFPPLVFVKGSHPRPRKESNPSSS